MPEPSQRRLKLKVDLEELAMALDDASGQASYYLDLVTGEVVHVTDEVRTTLNGIYQRLEEEPGEDEGQSGRKFDEVLAQLGLPDWLNQAVKEADQVEEGFGVRYVAVPGADSREGYQDMADFIATVADKRLAQLLGVAVSGRGAFRRFRDALASYPRERDRWFQFKNSRLRQRALEWLEDMDLQPE